MTEIEELFTKALIEWDPIGIVLKEIKGKNKGKD